MDSDVWDSYISYEIVMNFIGQRIEERFLEVFLLGNYDRDSFFSGCTYFSVLSFDLYDFLVVLFFWIYGFSVEYQKENYDDANKQIY